MQSLLVSRSKIQLVFFLLIVALLVLLFVYPRTEVYNYYQQLSKLGSDSVNNAASKFGFSNSYHSDVSELNRKYNLMDNTDVGFGRIKQFFNRQDNTECTIGDMTYCKDFLLCLYNQPDPFRLIEHRIHERAQTPARPSLCYRNYPASLLEKTFATKCSPQIGIE